MARDVLWGALAGALVVSFKGLHDLLLPNLGIAIDIYDDIWEQHLMGSRFLIPGFLYSHLTVPLMSGLTLPMVFLLLRLLLRKPWLVRVAFFLFIANFLPLALAPVALLALLATFLLERLGMVALMAMFSYFVLLHQAPMTTDLGVWYAENTMTALAIGTTVVSLCARWSTGRQPRPA